jgi:hypothetical protein
VLVRDGLNELHASESHDTESEDEAESELADGHVRGLLAGYALGGLDPDETELVTRHIRGCLACREELAAYQETADLLAFAAPARQVPLRARAGLLAKLDEVGTTNEQQLIVLRPDSTPPPVARSSWLPKLVWPQWSRARVAAFSAVPLLLLVGLVIAMGDRISDQQNEIAQIRQEQSDTDRTLARGDLDDPNTVQDIVPSSAALGAEGKLIIDRDAGTALLLVVGLPQPADGEQYIVWLEFAQNREFAKAGPLEVDPDGRAKLILNPSGSITLYDGVLITAESDPESPFPTGRELITAGIMPGK